MNSGGGDQGGFAGAGRLSALVFLLLLGTLARAQSGSNAPAVNAPAVNAPAVSAPPVNGTALNAPAESDEALPDAPTPQDPANKKKAVNPLLIDPAKCVDQEYATTNPEAASGLLVETKPCRMRESPFHRFLSSSEPQPLTPWQKLKLAKNDVIDPFNLLTIGVNSALYVGENAYSPYGPGLHGFGYNVGISLSQDATGEFFNTFAVPSVFHQDPHYHRLPGASLIHRVLHTAVAAIVMQGDNGQPMFNYADFIGFPIDAELSDLYVPDLQTNLSATAGRVLVGLATIPIGNMIAEFLPDVAKHVNVHVIFVQRVINQIARDDGSNAVNF